MKSENRLRLIFAKNLRNARLGLGISQEELAERAGVHRTYIGCVERGEKNVSVDTIEKLAKALGKTVIELFTKNGTA